MWQPTSVFLPKQRRIMFHVGNGVLLWAHDSTTTLRENERDRLLLIQMVVTTTPPSLCQHLQRAPGGHNEPWLQTDA